MKLGATIAAIVFCWSCSGTPVTRPTTPTQPTATQISTLAPVLSAQITPSIDKMRIGETLRFSVRVELGEGVPPSMGLPNWSSTNPAVIRIDIGGNATAVGTGTTTIEVIGKGFKTSRNVHVTT